MRRVVCFILVLVCMFALTCTAFATGFVGSPEGGEHCEHNYENGVCTLCGDVCVHDYENGVCTICGMKKPSSGMQSDNPKTGDTIFVWVTVMLVALIALVTVVVIYRKKFSVK